MSLPRIVENYLSARAASHPWQLAGCTASGFKGAVVIPALAESANLFATLQSLATNPPELLAQFLVVVVVNHRGDASITDQCDNMETLRKLCAGEGNFFWLNLAWVDAASPGLELPIKQGGVGLARKIGHDLVLPRLDCHGQDPVIISLDADTLVESTYLSAVHRHLHSTSAGGAVIPFSHRDGITEAETTAIVRYELFLRSYVLGLSLADSPYAYHSVGSAMACKASAYCRMGGMNHRAAGEDFYFLQHLWKTAGIVPIRGTTVHPSPRASHRVPFGTGKSVGKLLDGDEDAVLFYHPACFDVLKDWLELIGMNPTLSGGEIQNLSREVSGELYEFLNSAGFLQIWNNLQRNAKDPIQLSKSFHCWFDGLKTMKLIHHLSASSFPRSRQLLINGSLFQQEGMPTRASEVDLLLYLRTIQSNPVDKAI